ncbi:sigma-70 family RNA polymerase sigma factor [Streptomyces sp. NPDC052107]|uniref:RNA polymerase sigma factor n=1 Tax=Streptomyces sp. NPDC052107 TaxID=3155632 RepID=UPI0034388B26
MTERAHGSDEEDRDPAEQDMRDCYDAYKWRIWRFVASQLAGACKEDADDVCQETWTTFFSKYTEHVDKYDDLAMILFPIARCRIADYWRKRGRTPEAAAASEDLEALAHGVAPHCGVLIDDTTSRSVDLKRALADLTTRQREALHHHHVAGLTTQETARLMGITPHTVKKTLKVALAKLRVSRRLESYQSPADRRRFARDE